MKTFREFKGDLLAAGKDRLDPRVLKLYPDLDPTKARDYMKLKRLEKNLSPKIDTALKTEEAIAMAAPTNNVGDGKIAGTVEAGDDPPVKKKKRPPIMARGLLPGARTRFKKGADFVRQLRIQSVKM